MQHTREEVRRAVVRGKTLVLRPWEDTEVTIRTRDTEHAMQLVDAIQPFPDRVESVDLENMFHQVDMLVMLSAATHTKDIRRMLDTLNETYEQFKDDD